MPRLPWLLAFLAAIFLEVASAADAPAPPVKKPSDGGDKAAGEPSESELAEYKQDFLDFDLNKDNQIDAQEVRSQFKGDLDPKELHQFFIDVDKDSTGTVTLKEYIDYAVTLG
mmetsp:Transcript_36652/g.80319  ORF Transcript_36652/g.80319 Transcript_36652/m.80319 type:complete len:113 (+) Transcript_36652:104-442(+)|eukprot:CAMPEP_0170603024 /NCGR_PEP_ID=MMETSP0224-20130122/18699_1 /TAXON_ID=285029 /ORGANISM="Togula jolla, Strain CCCM 725" /LENGTH=112 /DNA_ID=CAMNT_0010927893 /DNA_START=53 /DNA_END=391 /DNA_ORIENTATION=+